MAGEILSTFYVTEFLAQSSLEHLRPKRPVPLAVELPVPVAEELIKHLQERIAAGDAGSIRIHLLGNLSHV